MGASKQWMAVPANVARAQALYRDTTKLLSMTKIAAELTTTEHNVRAALALLPSEEKKLLRSLRHSASKLGEMNPMFGKTMKKHHNFIGECGETYKTHLVNGERKFIHRTEAARMVGMFEIPAQLDVHHIDGDPTNNHPDNLAICTRVGHQKIHGMMQSAESKLLRSRRLNLSAYARYMISQSTKTPALE